MPWQEVSIMDQRRELVRLAMQEGANRRELFRRFGISPQTGYKWLARCQAGEPALADRSRRPQRSPERTGAELERQILQVRDAHPAWGARKIARCLIRAKVAPPATSTVHAVLRRNGRIADAPGGSVAYERFERPAPNQLWQMDFKGWVTLENGARCHPLTIEDDHSRYLLCLRACADQQGATVQGHLEDTFRRYGLPDAMFVDNGSPWGGSGFDDRWTRLGVWLLKLGVTMLYSRPYHPQGRGKNERLHRTLNAEVLSLRRFRDFGQAQRAFDDWRAVYNQERPHEALGQEVPASRYRPSVRSMPQTLPQPQYDSGEIVRRVGTTKAYVRFKGRLWPVGQAFFGEQVAIRPRGDDGQYGIFFGAHHIASIDLTTPRGVNHVSEQVSTMSSD
ncbi:MAG TPA: IS481 family transposase [Acetobacteraceae bacterium]|nr:IS481 family transposase [Acetobacteraceae bacterium]